jgi:phosphate:Na+ symporter
VKDRPATDNPVIETRYVSTDLLATPSIALDRVRMEIARTGTRVRDMVVAGVPATMSGTEAELAAVEASDDEVDHLHAQIVAYLGRIPFTDTGLIRRAPNR